ncbi:hypothetical protein [Oceanobacillus bengalensis]|nr:hypothetical protein [Oceanobacillus bengalensis]
MEVAKGNIVVTIKVAVDQDVATTMIAAVGVGHTVVVAENTSTIQ